jgi:hypothetical protein
MVRQIRQRLRAAKVKVVSSGTESVLVDASGTSCEGAAWNSLSALYRKHRIDFGLRPRHCKRRPAKRGK